MKGNQTYEIFQNKQKQNSVFTICIVLFIFINVLLDFSFTLFKNSSFHLFESLLFSSYWLLFLPFLSFTLQKTNTIEKQNLKLLLISSTIVCHSFSYPALVWIISKIFYYHTFNYWQTFSFGISTYFIKTIIIYGFSFYAFTFWNKKNHSLQIKPEVEKKTDKQDYIKSILIVDNNNKKSILEVSDILYFSANSPYINIYLSAKKYLYTQTLKSLEKQLDDKQFVRIHKSYIVNIHKIYSIQSRQNGDYDITISDKTILRLSRNYTKNFKSKFSDFHQLKIK